MSGAPRVTRSPLVAALTIALIALIAPTPLAVIGACVSMPELNLAADGGFDGFDGGVGDSASGDAAPDATANADGASVEDAEVEDAAVGFVCPATCTSGCVGTTCMIRGAGGATCPPGLSCQVSCPSKDACEGTITCAPGQPCVVECTAEKACNSMRIEENGASSLCLRCSGGKDACNSVTCAASSCAKVCSQGNSCNSTCNNCPTVAACP